MVDLHCHILPQTDDGAKTWEQALEMCRVAVADGVTDIVATPHFKSIHPYDRQRNAETLRQLQEQAGTCPRLHLGSELFLSPENLEAALSNPGDYVIAGTHYLLLELSNFSVPSVLPGALQRLQEAGLRPILAHPERHPFLQRRPEPVLEWVRCGLVVQVTSDSLTGFWGRMPQLVAQWLLEQNAVHLVASDAHDPRTRPPMLSLARQILIEWQNEEVADALVKDNPAAILRDESF